jgi:hypothetical protein
MRPVSPGVVVKGASWSAQAVSGLDEEARKGGSD